LSDLPEFGEGALKNCLPYDEVPKARFTKWSDGRGLFVDELKRRSQARVQGNQEFRYVMEDMERLRKRLDENRISLNEDVRRSELNEDKLRKETRAKERLARQGEEMQMIRLTLDNVDKPNIQPIIFPSKLAANKKKVAPEAATDADSESTITNDDGTKEPAIDPERDETLNILADLVDLNRGPTTASTSASVPPQ
jgi:carboxyl-terminal processing protease